MTRELGTCVGGGLLADYCCYYNVIGSGTANDGSDEESQFVPKRSVLGE
jgi:hypothetical protein